MTVGDGLEKPVATYDLDGQVMVVTGGSGGIGRAFTRLARSAGAKVCSWDMSRKPDDDADSFVEVDVTSEASVAAALETVLSEFGRLDAMVNSAGITGPVMDCEQYGLGDWQRVMAINLTGTFLCCRAAIAPMKAAGYGRIVNVASIAGKEGNPRQVAYTASKAGVIGLTKALGKELAATGIRVNCITPGFTATDLIHQMTQAQRDFVLEKIPMGRPGNPEEIAEMMLWMASPSCSFTTGAVFDASGGRAGH